MNKLIKACWYFLILNIILISFSTIGLAQDRIILEKISGTVEYKTSSWFFFSSNWKKVKKQVSLKEGDIIKTAPQSQAQVTFGNQARTLIKENSKLELIEAKRKFSLSKIELTVGEVIVKFINSLGNNRKFEVETPSAVAGVRGTLFRVIVDKMKETNVIVNNGKVAVSSGGGRVLVTKGKTAIVKNKREKPKLISNNKSKKKKKDENWIKKTNRWQKEAKKQAQKEAKEQARKDKENRKENKSKEGRENSNKHNNSERDNNHNNPFNSKNNKENDNSNDSSSEDNNSNNHAKKSDDNSEQDRPDNGKNNHNNNKRGRGK